MIRIVTDLHHSVLYESLAMLFVDRAILGPAELLVWVDGHYVTRGGPQTQEFGRKPWAMTTAALQETGSVAIVISTVGGTRGAMDTVAGNLGALYVDHIGNAWDEPVGKTVLRAAYGPGEKGIVYHPEFHRAPWTPPVGERIGSFHASLHESPCGALWHAERTKHPEYEWTAYGGSGRLLRPADVAHARAGCIAQWHCKDADGYGFGVHEAFAAGRAVIGHGYHYRDKLAEPLFVRGSTYLEPGEWGDFTEIGYNAVERFEELVDFNAEAQTVKAYLEARL